MFIDRINLNQLRIFEAVFRLKSMTLAAEELHLTQSGISQHMKVLEGALGISLFDRISQKLYPTEKAIELYEVCKEQFDSLEHALQNFHSHDEMKGKVRIGMPVEFGVNIVIPLLGVIHQKHPELRYQITFDFASVLDEMLLHGEIDFAFIDDYRMSPGIEVEEVFKEKLVLCIHREKLKTFGPVQYCKDYFEKIDFVAYQKNYPLLKLWFKEMLDWKHPKLQIKAQVMDVQGVARFIQGKVGAGVLPSHLVQKLKKEGHDLYSYRQGDKNAVINPLKIAFLSEKTQSASVCFLMNEVKSLLSSLR
ncbi:MAG: hypothetical protein CL678_05155 [Bdellovibrionaceae bacterium]|nr:hypothetical protein [Pseudobdellovibrionaceae bacterium]|tara:strand:+ start:2793 stop:3710 length:918 start_codon:yes stop_codon:yes gene_type:complete